MKRHLYLYIIFILKEKVMGEFNYIGSESDFSRVSDPDLVFVHGTDPDTVFFLQGSTPDPVFSSNQIRNPGSHIVIRA